MKFNHNYVAFSLLNKDIQWSVLTIHGGYLFKSLESFHRCLNMFCFVNHWKNKLKLDWVHISADRKTYLVSLIASSVFLANGAFEVYFYIKMLSKFILHFFQQLIYVTSLVLGCCTFSNLRTAVKLFAAVLWIKETNVIVVEDSSHKCICNNSTRENENLKDLFRKSYILNLNWG